MSESYARLDMTEVRDIEQRLGAIGANVKAKAEVYGAEAILAEAQADSPVRSGFLQSTHVVDRRGSAGTVGDISRRTPLRVAISRIRKKVAVVIGVNASYGLAVHETHPTKSRWFVNAVKANYHRIMRGAIKKALREEGSG